MKEYKNPCVEGFRLEKLNYCKKVYILGRNEMKILREFIIKKKSYNREKIPVYFWFIEGQRELDKSKHNCSAMHGFS